MQRSFVLVVNAVFVLVVENHGIEVVEPVENGDLAEVTNAAGAVEDLVRRTGARGLGIIREQRGNLETGGVVATDRKRVVGDDDVLAIVPDRQAVR